MGQVVGELASGQLTEAPRSPSANTSTAAVGCLDEAITGELGLFMFTVWCAGRLYISRVRVERRTRATWRGNTAVEPRGWDKPQEGPQLVDNSYCFLFSQHIFVIS